jgi:CIC family chloride channel protein
MDRGAPPVETPSLARLGRIFHDTLLGYLRGLSPRSRRFWILVPVVGLLAGVAAVGAIHLLHLVQRLAWGTPDSVLEGARGAPWWRRLTTPMLGGAIVILVGLTFGSESAGHGTTHIIESIWVRRGRVPLLRAVVRGSLTLIVVGLGASLGREGALIYFGAAAASWLGRRAQLEPDQLKVLVACGATAGIAAAYNTPIGGALFGLEIFLGGLALELYGPLIFASVAATLVSRALLSDHPSYDIPHYTLHRPSELLLYLVLGVLIGGVSALFVRTVDITSRTAARLPERLRRWLPLSATALVGAVGIVYPEVYGNGYDAVNRALVGGLPLRLLLVLPGLKLLLSAVCASSGLPGALFTPSLFVGGLAGGAFGALAHLAFPHLVPQTGGYVVVGMAAILAGSTHATLAAALLLFELTGNYELILPLLAACVVSTAVSRQITAESIYTAPLRRRGVELPRITRPAWMQREGVRRLVQPDAPAVSPSAPLEQVLLALLGVEEGESLYVVDERGRLVGRIGFETVRDVLADLPQLELLVAADLMQPTSAISLDASLWDVTRRALAADSGRLPVQSPREGGRLVGTVAIADVLAAARTRA